MHLNRCLVVAATLWAVLLPHSLGTATELPNPVELLFARTHLAALDAGAEIAYRFERNVSDSRLLGDPFSDEIKLVVTTVAANGTRAVAVSVFSGERAREVQNIPEMTGNPVLVVFLDRAVNNMRHLTGGSRPYLKDRMRAGLRERAEIAPTSIRYKDQDLDAFRITLTPFAKDPNAGMRVGFDGAKFTFVVSEAVPGHLVEMISTYESTLPDAPRLEERITLVGAGNSP